jgi:hypothetical protein
MDIAQKKEAEKLPPPETSLVTVEKQGADGIATAAMLRREALARRAEASLGRIHLAMSNLEKQLAKNPGSHALNALQQKYQALQGRAQTVINSLNKKHTTGADRHDDDDHQDDHHDDGHHGHHGDDQLHSDVTQAGHMQDRTTGAEPFMVPVVSMGGSSMPGFSERRMPIIRAMRHTTVHEAAVA